MGEWVYWDCSWGIYRGYYGDPFPLSPLSTRELSLFCVHMCDHVCSVLGSLKLVFITLELSSRIVQEYKF